MRLWPRFTLNWSINSNQWGREKRGDQKGKEGGKKGGKGCDTNLAFFSDVWERLAPLRGVTAAPKIILLMEVSQIHKGGESSFIFHRALYLDPRDTIPVNLYPAQNLTGHSALSPPSPALAIAPCCLSHPAHLLQLLLSQNSEFRRARLQNAPWGDLTWPRTAGNPFPCLPLLCRAASTSVCMATALWDPPQLCWPPALAPGLLCGEGQRDTKPHVGNTCFWGAARTNLGERCPNHKGMKGLDPAAL